LVRSNNEIATNCMVLIYPTTSSFPPAEPDKVDEEARWQLIRMLQKVRTGSFTSGADAFRVLHRSRQHDERRPESRLSCGVRQCQRYRCVSAIQLKRLQKTLVFSEC
jgi:hypothetical protein